MQVFNSNGEFLGKWSTHNPGDGQYDRPVNIAVDGKGTVYVAIDANGADKVKVFKVAFAEATKAP